MTYADEIRKTIELSDADTSVNDNYERQKIIVLAELADAADRIEMLESLLIEAQLGRLA